MCVCVCVCVCVGGGGGGGQLSGKVSYPFIFGQYEFPNLNSRDIVSLLNTSLNTLITP